MSSLSARWPSLIARTQIVDVALDKAFLDIEANNTDLQQVLMATQYHDSFANGSKSSSASRSPAPFHNAGIPTCMLVQNGRKPPALQGRVIIIDAIRECLVKYAVLHSMEWGATEMQANLVHIDDQPGI
ncbi:MULTISPECIES: hypothetical protein [Achromobacter]|uniref:hypothetical protein n=1 Tax=Achromobacter TaxID=222 RepID=UPI0025BF3645|nr:MULTISPECIES: hypothetical protein [Achromobacter]